MKSFIFILCSETLKSFTLEAFEAFNDMSSIDCPNLENFRCVAINKYPGSSDIGTKGPLRMQKLIKNFQLEQSMISSFYTTQTETIFWKYDRLKYYNGIDISDLK